MTIYVVMVDDRHTDPEAHLFSHPRAAINFAKTQSEIYGEPTATMSEEDLIAVGWLFCAQWERHGLSIWILPKEVDCE